MSFWLPSLRERFDTQETTICPLTAIPEENVGAAKRQKLDEQDAFMEAYTGTIKPEGPINAEMYVPPEALLLRVCIEDHSDECGALNVPLLKHQKMALEWMIKQEGEKGGGILADDQGLGKTVSTLAFLSKAGVKDRASWDPLTGGTLVVCPLSVLKQWQREIASKMSEGHKFTTLVYHGAARMKFTPWELASYDLVVTTYEMVTKDVPYRRTSDVSEDDVGPVAHHGHHKAKLREILAKNLPEGPLAKVEWHRVVLDEVQCIKNSYTQVSLACSNLKSKYRWGLSGTPLQNSISELFSFFRFLRVAPYNSCSVFKQRIRGELQEAVKSIMLRRTKSTFLNGEPILVLPERYVTRLKVTLSPQETAFYMSLKEIFSTKFDEYRSEGTIKMHTSNILTMLLRLRQTCDHPKLVFGKIGSDDLMDYDQYKVLEVRKMVEQQLAAAFTMSSSKIAAVMRLVKMVPNGEKMLVFSQWTSMLDLLEPDLREAGVGFERLDGTMTLAQRDAAIERFTSDEGASVMLMSLKAASLGLNLVVASHVLMIDPWWNPTTEDQAIDRAHRIGQTRPVYVTRLTVEGTVEDRILSLQENKRQMVKSAFGTSEWGNENSLSIEDLCFLFS